MEADGPYLTKLSKDRCLITEIERLAITTNTGDQRLKVLAQVFDLICALSQRPCLIALEASSVESDEKVVKEWYALLDIIKAIESWAPNGAFLAARLSVFVLHAFLNQTALEFDLPVSTSSLTRIDVGYKFLFTLDEALLRNLRTYWNQSQRRDGFYWITTYFDWEVGSEFNRLALMAMSPAELWDVPGMKAASLHGASSQDSITYYLEPDDETRGMWITRRALCRSSQFVLDARRIAHPWLVAERRRLALICTRELPMELQYEVLSHLEPSEEQHQHHPYLSRLDLSAVYAPFYKPQDAGDEEPWTTAESIPHKDIRVWNMALRIFHTFHATAEGTLELCDWMEGCSGYHSDDEFLIQNVEKLEHHFHAIIKSRCGNTASLISVGLGREPQDIDNQVYPPKPLAYAINERAAQAEQELLNAFQLTSHRLRHQAWPLQMFRRDGTIWPHSTDEEPEWIRAASIAEEGMILDRLEKIAWKFS